MTHIQILGFGTPVFENLKRGDFVTSYRHSVNSSNFLLALISAGYVGELHNVYNRGSVPDYDPALLSFSRGSYVFSQRITMRTVNFYRHTEIDFAWNAGVDLVFLSLSPEYTDERFLEIADYIRSNFMDEIPVRVDVSPDAAE